MAIVASRRVSMTRILPRVIVRLHDVAIRTSGWIVRQIGSPTTVIEGKRTQANRRTDQYRGQNRQPAKPGLPSQGLRRDKFGRFVIHIQNF